MNSQERRAHNEAFLRRLLARRPEERARYESLLAPRSVPEFEFAAAEETVDVSERVLETIVDSERPVLFIKDGRFDTTNATILGNEAKDLVAEMKSVSDLLLPTLPLIGRIDVVNFPGTDFLGTAWFVENDVVVTNRHVASLIARWDGRKFVFSRGMGGRPLESSLCNAHEFDDLDPDADRIFKIKEVLYIEPDSGPHDIAFLRVERRTNGAALPFIPIAEADVDENVVVCVIGYPARAPRRVIPDQELMDKLYLGRFDLKRAAPGFTTGTKNGTTTHDCTTLGGNSGSVLMDLRTHRAVGLHFAGLYQQDNFAVRASVLTDYVRRKRWNQPPVIETRPPALKPVRSDANQGANPAFPPSVGPMTWTIPLTITIGLGAPVVTAHTSAGVPGPAAPIDVARVEQAVLGFWDSRPEGVLAARVGYFDEADRIGDRPCIAASVAPATLAAIKSSLPGEYQGVPIRYLPADVDEQIQAHPLVEAVDSIAYDDDARTAAKFSFEPIEEEMDVILHVGPEYSWEVLEKFLSEARGKLVSAMYEFHGPHIKDAIEQRLENGASLSLVLDNATFSGNEESDEEFDRVAVFEDWEQRFGTKFTRIVAPEGTSGLISDSYHIKVTVRSDDTFWLSSGNWKMGSSQPPITEEQRENATEVDLPGNREWHVVIKNKTLATRFRSHITQDAKRSRNLGGGPLPRRFEEVFVDIPLEEEAIMLERRPPNRILKPKLIRRAMKVRPLLTPDREGAVFSEAVLELIRSARTSLLFQIPYIGMPSNPRQDRGFIDELIKQLTTKLKSLDDARVLLRRGGSRLSSPSHAAWFFKSKGVDIDARLRLIDDHHTKGMIVDGRRVLLGSHNWSKPGVSLNRDASLIFDDADVADYYTEAFEIDWARANKITPKKFVEAVALEAVGDAPPPGYRRIRLSDVLKDD